MVDLIPAIVDRLYRDLASAKAPQSQPVSVDTVAKKIALTRADVNAIIGRTRIASPDELQYIIDHARDLKLTPGERNQLGVDLSIVVAQRARQVNGRREDPSAQFIAQLHAGCQAIERCKLHRPPMCQCWSASRAVLWQARADGEKTPQNWAAVRSYSFLEELELASRPEIECSAVRES